MKKFLSKIMFAAVAILSVAGFASCNNADDDPYVPTPASAQEQAKPVITDVAAYEANVSEDLLDMFDITLVLHNGDKTKEVVLSKENGEKVDLVFASAYKFYFNEVDGQKGVFAVDAKVTPKADVESVIKRLSTNETMTMAYGGGLFKAKYDASGNYVNKADKHISTYILKYFPAKMLDLVDNSQKAYQMQAETLEVSLTHN